MHTDLDVCVCLCMPLTFYLFAYKRRLNPITASTPALPTLSATPQLFHGASRLGCCVHFWSVSVRDWHFFSLHFKCNLPLAHVCTPYIAPSAPPPHPQYSPLFAVCPLLSATGSANCSASASDMLFGDFECAALEIPKKKFRVANEFLQRTRTHPQPHSHRATHTQAHTYRETHTNMTTHTTAFTCRNA